MADKNYKLKFTLTDGKTQEVEFTAPQGPKGDQGVQGVQGPAGANGAKGERGTSIIKVATGPLAYTTTTGGFTPTHRIALSTVLSESGVDKVMVGDTLAYSYYQWLIGYIDTSHVYLGGRSSLRGATGETGSNGFSIYTITGNVPMQPDKEGNNEVSREDIDNPTGRVVQIGDFIYKSSSGELYNVVAASDTTVSISYYATLKPKKGIDYWTAADIADIESYIDTAVVDTFGKGTSIPSGADLNEYMTIGKYYANAGSVAASLVNCPTKNNFMMYVFTRTTDGVPSQMIIDLSGKLYLRSRSTSTWQSWVTYITKSDLTSALAEALQDAKESGDFAGDSKVAYAICDTEAATSAKVAAVSGNDNWTLQVGSIVMVYFSISNSAKNVTLNVNDSGAYPIWYNNAEYASNGTAYTGYAKRVIIYMFNGTHWVWIGASYEADTNTYQRLYVTTGSAEYPITTRYNTTTGNNYYAEYGRYSEGVTLNPSTNTITATAFKGKLTGNADTATKATQDASGNNIANTYAKKSSAEEWTFTLEDDTVVTKKVVLA